MRKLLVLLALSAAPVTPVAAAVTYDLAGAFKPNDGASFRVLLGGGSFDGSFVLAGATFPTSGTVNFVSYTINLRDSTGTVVKTISQAAGAAASGYFSYSAASSYGGPVLNFYLAAGGVSQNSLFLVVPNGFTGTGGIVPNSASSAAVGAQQAIVTSARIAPHTAAVPEPATWGMMILGFGALGLWSRGGRGVARRQDRAAA